MWSPEARAREAARIRQHQPWLKSTGPRTNAGKQRSSRNAAKGGLRPHLRELAQLLRQINATSSPLPHSQGPLAARREME